MDPIEQLSVVVPSVTELADRLDAVSLRQPTPCAAFDVEGVLEHMIAGATAFAPAFRGDDVAPPSPLLPVATRFRIALRELLASVRSPGAMERMVTAPFGEVSGEFFARFVAFDGLVHGHDLAVGGGLSFDPPVDLVAEVDAFARTALAPELRDGDTFAAEQEPPLDATPLERLAAFSGRVVTR